MAHLLQHSIPGIHFVALRDSAAPLGANSLCLEAHERFHSPGGKGKFHFFANSWRAATQRVSSAVSWSPLLDNWRDWQIQRKGKRPQSARSQEA
jgi:hypothetical protein